MNPATDMALAGEFAVAAEDPCLAGHFPGQPVVPGVVIIDRALALIGEVQGAPAAIPRVKFLAPVLPGCTVQVFSGYRDRRLVLRCLVDGTTVAEGQCEPV